MSAAAAIITMSADWSLEQKVYTLCVLVAALLVMLFGFWVYDNKGPQ